MKLYELTDQMKGLQALIDEGELDAEALADTLEGLSADIVAKGGDVLMVLANLEADSKAFDAEIKRMQARKKALDSHHDWLKEYLRKNMIESGITKIESPLFTATLKAPAKRVEIVDEKLIPLDYQELIPASWSIKKVAISKALKDGIDVPGAILVDGQSPLVIR